MEELFYAPRYEESCHYVHCCCLRCYGLALTFGFPASAQFTNADGSPVYSSSFPAQWDGNVLATVWQGSREFRTDNLQNLPANAPDSSNVSFLPAVTYSTGDHNPYAIAIADVNEDGKPDLIVGNHGSQNAEGSVAVLLGNGDGTFGAAVDYDSGGITAYSVVVADINGDSKPDLVVADGCAGNDCSTGAIGVLLGNGDGTFRPALVYKVVGGAFFGAGIAFADLNGDGNLDVAVETAPSACCASGVVSVLLGNGDGTFKAAVGYPTGGFVGNPSVAIADVNGDSKPDLVVSNYCATHCSYPPTVGSVGVLLGNGDGTFRSVVTYSSGGYGTSSVAVADLNKDAKPDILVASCGPGACGPGFPEGVVSVLAGNGDGTFQSAVPYAGANGPISVVAVDVNGDNNVDVVVANWGTSNGGSNAGAVSVLLGNGDGTLQPVITYLSGGAESRSVAVADLNGDHKPDIALACVDDIMTGAQGVASVLLNNTPTFHDHIVLVSSGSPSHVGQPVTFTATVLSKHGVIPDGELVTFYDGKVVLASVPLSGSMAAFTTSALTVGSHYIKAIYPGDSTFLPSRKRIIQVVEP